MLVAMVGGRIAIVIVIAIVISNKWMLCCSTDLLKSCNNRN